MKKTTRGTSVLRRLSLLLLTVMLMASLLCSGSVYALGSNEVSRLNVMLVIDGSGSLTMDGGTDNSGYRYDAIDLFLALLTNSGNHVGAIVFNHETLLHAPIAPINGKADKVALSQKIKDAGAYGDTNTGDALLAAVDTCSATTAQNGLKSVILLFSDGNINMDYHGGEEAVERSREAQETAINKAQEVQIPIHTICLNDNASYSNPEEMKEISDRTYGSYTSVTTSKDLAVAFENFYKLIFPGASNEISQTTFPADGNLNFDIQIPTYGAEEVNIIVNTKSLSGKTIAAPSCAMSDSTIEDNTMTGGQYAVTKLVDPEKGLWNVSLSGTPGSEVTVNVLYNIDSAAQLRTGENKTDYGVGETATFQVNLLQQGNMIADSIVTQEYTAKLILKNLTTGEELAPLDMTPDANGTFVCTYTGTDYNSFSAKAVLSYANLNLYSNEMAVNFGNSAPVANPAVHEVKATVTPISGKSKNVDVSAFFSDSQDATLTYSIVSSQLIQNTADLDAAGLLTVNTAKSRSGDVVIQATDSQGATAQMIVRFKVTNLTWVIFGTIIAAVLGGLIVGGSILYLALNKPFKGMVFVTNTANGIRRSHGSFRGRVPLSKLGLTGSNCGIEGGVLVSIGNNRLELRTKRDVYCPGVSLRNPKRIILGLGRNTIYSDNTMARGIQIEIQPSARR